MPAIRPESLPPRRAPAGSKRRAAAAIRIEPMAAPGAGEVEVRALHSAVSRGTESLVFRGQVPASEFERMRAPFQAGGFPAPVKYGYASVGIVEQGAEGWPGRLVFCLYPHQTRYVVPVDAVHPLPDGVPPGRAVLAANMETAVNALWDAAPRVGDRITVVGGGVVGLLVAWLAARLPGCEVELVDVQASRARRGRAARRRLRAAARRRGPRPTWCCTPAASPRAWPRAGAGGLRGHRDRTELVRAAARCRCRSARPSTRGGWCSGAPRSATWPRRSAAAGRTGGGWRWPCRCCAIRCSTC